MRSGKALLGNLSSILVFTAAGFLMSTGDTRGQEVEHLRITQPGGMPGLPVMTGIDRVTNGVKITWDGPPGYYQLLRRLGLTTQPWQPVGGPNAVRNATFTNIQGDAFFRVSGPSPQYAGAQVCAECHENVHSVEMLTRHAGAFSNPEFVAKGGQTNSSCLPCHTVGFGLPTGFVSKHDVNSNPRLAGVQCENCHGPAANHAANENDPTVRPRADIASTVCGGCHNVVSHRPHYEEWKSSGHAQVSEENMNPNSCGRCHIGSARIAMVKGDPVPQNDSHIGVTCAVCHDPHASHVWTNVMTGLTYTNQLRNPLSSTNDYFLTTSDVFSLKYDPNINICAQCHNSRGARWDGRSYGYSNGVYVLTTNVSFSRPPHHSPQYNMLLSTVGVLPAGVSAQPGAHAGTRILTDFLGQKHLVTNQCVTCHMQTEPHQAGPPEVPAVTGHEFRFTSFAACTDCHGSGANEESLRAWSETVSNRIQQVKSLLDQWALTEAPAPIQKYDSRAWEYDNAGELSSPDGNLRGPVSSSDPNKDEQKYIPENIKKARFNLYLVAYDGSFGVHNPIYANTLLNTARDWVYEELYE